MAIPRMEKQLPGRPKQTPTAAWRSRIRCIFRPGKKVRGLPESVFRGLCSRLAAHELLDAGISRQMASRPPDANISG